MRIACLGLGRMGWHMAGHLANLGEDYNIVVFDVVEELGDQWAAEFPGTTVDSVARASSFTFSPMVRAPSRSQPAGTFCR